jgi:hypothetical protein
VAAKALAAHTWPSDPFCLLRPPSAPPGCPQSKVQSWKIFTPQKKFSSTGCKGDKNFGKKNSGKLEELRWFVMVIKKFGQKNSCKLEELRWFVTVIKKFGQKNPCKLEELRWFVTVIKKIWSKKPM